MESENMSGIMQKISLMKLHAQDHLFQPVLLLELIDDIDEELIAGTGNSIWLEQAKLLFLAMKERFTKNGLMGSDEWSPEELEEQYKKERKDKNG